MQLWLANTAAKKEKKGKEKGNGKERREERIRRAIWRERKRGTIGQEGEGRGERREKRPSDTAQSHRSCSAFA